MFLIACIGIVVGGGQLFGQANTQAQERDRIDLAGLARGPAVIGGGFVVGEPTGLTGKFWYPESGFAVDAAAAWSLSAQRSLYMHSDIIYHLALIETEGGRYIIPSIGFGVLGRFGSDVEVGVRLPVALSLFLFPSVPVEIYGEIAPGVGVVPDTDEEFGLGMGIRFYFPVGS